MAGSSRAERSSAPPSSASCACRAHVARDGQQIGHQRLVDRQRIVAVEDGDAVPPLGLRDVARRQHMLAVHTPEAIGGGAMLGVAEIVAPVASMRSRNSGGIARPAVRAEPGRAAAGRRDRRGLKVAPSKVQRLVTRTIRWRNVASTEPKVRSSHGPISGGGTITPSVSTTSKSRSASARCAFGSAATRSGNRSIRAPHSFLVPRRLSASCMSSAPHADYAPPMSHTLAVARRMRSSSCARR